MIRAIRRKSKGAKIASLGILCIMVFGSIVLANHVFVSAQQSYSVKFVQNGSGKQQPTVHYSLSNGTVGSKTTPFTISVQSGLTLSYAYDQYVPGNNSGIRFALVSVIPPSPQMVSSALTINATYKTQYQVSFNQIGSGVPPLVTYYIYDNLSDPTNVTQAQNVVVPFSIWVNSNEYLWYNISPSPGACGYLTPGQLTFCGTVPNLTYYLTSLAGPAQETDTIVSNPLSINATYQKMIPLVPGQFQEPSFGVAAIYDPNNGQIFVTGNSGGTTTASDNVYVIDGNNGSSTENDVTNVIQVGTLPTGWLLIPLQTRFSWSMKVPIPHLS
jgi:hypothetical protein